jgi:hypothetical protein
MTVTTVNLRKRTTCENNEQETFISSKFPSNKRRQEEKILSLVSSSSVAATMDAKGDLMNITDGLLYPLSSKMTFTVDSVKDFMRAENLSTLTQEKKKRLLFNVCERGTPEALAYLLYESNLQKIKEDLGVEDDLNSQTCLHFVCGANKKYYTVSPPETDNTSSSESLLNKVKILLNIKPELMTIKDKQGNIPFSYVNVETWNQWFRLPICLVSDSASSCTSESYSKQEHRRQENHKHSMKSYHNSSISSDTIMNYSTQEDEVSQLTQSTRWDNSHHLEEEEVDFTEHEMVVHVTAILASRLEILMHSRQDLESENNGDSSPPGPTTVFSRHQSLVTDTIKTEVDLFVRMVSAMYREVPYHSFDHAHHVVSATNDLLDMLVPADDNDDDPDQHPCSHDLFNNSMSHLALVFAALIHDVDHTGIVNAELAKDDSDQMSMLYGGDDSNAEKNSIVVGCMLLMRPELKKLQRAMFQSDYRDFSDFQSIVHKLIMTTDICNRQTTQHLKDTWCQAFGNEPTQDVCLIEKHHPPSSLCRSTDVVGANSFQSIADEKNDKLRALVVMFSMMRAADVLHLMEDWDTFLKWSNRCYMEFRAAYQSGKGEDPGSSWYENQIGFLDFYVIPLAKNLHFSRAFGEFGEEFVNNILSNKEQWMKEGKQISSRLLTEVESSV